MLDIIVKTTFHTVCQRSATKINVDWAILAAVCRLEIIFYFPEGIGYPDTQEQTEWWVVIENKKNELV